MGYFIKGNVKYWVDHLVYAIYVLKKELITRKSVRWEQVTHTMDAWDTSFFSNRGEANRILYITY